MLTKHKSQIKVISTMQKTRWFRSWKNRQNSISKKVTNETDATACLLPPLELKEQLKFWWCLPLVVDIYLLPLKQYSSSGTHTRTYYVKREYIMHFPTTLLAHERTTEFCSISSSINCIIVRFHLYRSSTLRAGWID